VRLTVSLEETEHEAVEGLAEKRGVSIASIIREAVREYVARRRF
jgi:predicted transcriptional regulator